MRTPLLLVLALVLAGCGSSANAGINTGAGATPTPPVSHQSFSQAPPMTIDKNANYTATVVTTDGTFVIRLLPKVAPIAVNNFVFLTRHHFYNGVIFHRILKNYIVQTGDPEGTGFGGPGYTFRDEKVTMPYTRGTVAMANSGPNTNGSQFFIFVEPADRRVALAPNYTIFGRVIRGMNAVQKISDEQVTQSATDPNEYSKPLNPPQMTSVTIQQS